MRVCILLLATWSIAMASDYFVNTGGDDASAGTQAAPWRTVGKVNALALTAGDRIFFGGGQPFSDAGLSFDSGDVGNSTSPIVVGTLTAALILVVQRVAGHLVHQIAAQQFEVVVLGE